MIFRVFEASQKEKKNSVWKSKHFYDPPSKTTIEAKTARDPGEGLIQRLTLHVLKVKEKTKAKEQNCGKKASTSQVQFWLRFMYLGKSNS